MLSCVPSLTKINRLTLIRTTARILSAAAAHNLLNLKFVAEHFAAAVNKIEILSAKLCGGPRNCNHANF